MAYHRCNLKKFSAADNESDARLSAAVRAHANFAEYTPFAFGLLFLAELNGAPTAWVHGAYATLFAARVAHSVGMVNQCFNGILRKVGFLTTLAVTLGAGVYNFSLGYEPLKSFLGIQ